MFELKSKILHQEEGESRLAGEWQLVMSPKPAPDP